MAWGPWLIAALIGAATLLAYRGALLAPLSFDDGSVVLEHRSIRDWSALAPGRPIANLSLAINYAIGGTNPAGYHATNIVLHACSALLLFGVLRRTLITPGLRDRFASAADLLAGATSLLWALHPLQTESVVWVAQRAELVVGLFYLLTLYCYLRGAASGRALRWYVLAIAACALGMASSEVMVTAPLIVLLHDATFVGGSWREAWRARRGLHAGLAATWLVLAALVAQSGGGVAMGSGLGASWWTYALKQCEAIVRYAWLSLWPNPLVLDYGSEVVTSPADVRWEIVALLGLAGLTLFALRRRMAIGFIGAWFMVILAPTSSVVPMAGGTIAEYRMYLPLAAVLVLMVVAGYSVTGKRSLGIWLALPMVLVALTRERVADYESELRIWGDTVLKRPFNARAHVKLGDALKTAGKLSDALTQYEVAVKLQPTKVETLSALARALLAADRIDEAIGCATEAVRLASNSAVAHYTLATVFARAGRVEAAMVECEAALRIDAGHAEAKRLIKRLRQ